MTTLPCSLVRLCHGDRDRDAGAGPELAQLTVAVRGDSMRPLLEPGDHVMVLPCRPHQLSPGDIVLVDGPTPLVHRYLFRTRAGCFSKGDANRSADHPWPPEQLVGRVPVRLRCGRATRLDRGLRRWVAGLAARALWLRHRTGQSLRR